MMIPSLVLLAFGAVGHVILWVGLVNRIHAIGIHRRLVDLVTALCGLALVGAPALVGAALLPVAAGRTPWLPHAYSVAAWFYVGFCALVSVAAGLQRWRWCRHSERHGHLLSNHTSAIDVAAACSERLTAPGIPTWLSRLPRNEVLTTRVHFKEIAIPRWTAPGGGLRIVHLSDLHMSGRITRAYFQHVVEEVNRCEPDLVVITGDLVERKRCLDWVPSTFGRLRATGGVYYVLGNHDRHVGKPRLTAALDDAGLIYLGGTWREVSIRETPVILAGNELPWYGPAADLSHCPPRDARGLPLRVLLTHSPDQFGWAQANDVDLMLAGHVHGGQVCLPLLGPIMAPSLHGVRYASGTFRAGNTLMHVSRGTSSLTPLRYNCPPEIAVLNLRAAIGLEAAHSLKHETLVPRLTTASPSE